MDTNYQPKNFTSTKQPQAGDIIQGTVISTAKIQLADRVRIVVVFNTSTYHLFFHEFEARNMRTPRKRWTWTKQYHSIYGSPTGGFFSLESYAEYICKRYKGSRITIKRYIKSKELRAQIENTIHPQPAQPRPGDTFGVSSRITSGTQNKITRYDRSQAWKSWNEQHGK